VPRLADSPWTDEEKLAAIETLQVKRTDIAARPHSTAKAALLHAIDEAIAELQLGSA
jgi:hypothetical protein